MTFLTAEAGYGKTTLLGEFAQQSTMRLLWYRIDEQDRDWIGALNYLVAAGRDIMPGFAPVTADLLMSLGTGSISKEQVVESFIGELQALRDAPTMLVFDDWHLVDGLSDFRTLARALIDRAPAAMSFLFSSRHRPTVSVARHRAAGEVVELSTDDLRFGAEETERLFRETYRHPLDPDVVLELVRRTEGWAASLQLVQAALRQRSRAEARSFVAALSGVDDNLYDYLAEVVVGDLDVDLQVFLMKSSILQEVTEDLANVLLVGSGVEFASLAERLERTGLLPFVAPSRQARRFHPLVRQFLRHRLESEHDGEAIQALHRRVARYAQSSDWRLATHHFAEAGDLDNAHQIIESSVFDIMSGGDYAIVADWIALYPPSRPSAVHEIVASRLHLYSDRPSEALEHAMAAAELSMGGKPELRDLCQLNLAGLSLTMGDAERTALAAKPLSATATDPMVRDIAEAYLLMIEANNEGSLRELAAHLTRLGDKQREAGRRFFAGVSYLNAGAALKAIGDADAAKRWGEEAYELLKVEPIGFEQASAASIVAWSLAAMGSLSEAADWVSRASSVKQTLTRFESLCEVADIQTWFGSAEEAGRSIESAKAVAPLVGTRHSLVTVAEATLALRLGDVATARALLDRLSPLDVAVDVGMGSRVAFTWANIGWLEHDPGVAEQAQEAIRRAERQDADLWVGLAKTIAAYQAPATEFSHRLADQAARHPYSISMAAELVLSRLGELDDNAMKVVVAEVQVRPERWRDGLRLMVDDGSQPSATRAANLLERIGEREDIVRLRRFAKTLRGNTQDATIGKALARSLAARVFVEDQNRVRILVGGVAIEGARIRRKVLALLCFLLSRPGFAAAKDQILDALWPELDPVVAANSLNQTVYFLRRVFEPDHKDDLSADYVHHESDVIWLDPELITSRSEKCGAIMRGMAEDLDPTASGDLSRTYMGPFALEFLYEEWAVAHRSAQHANYVQIVERASRRDAEIGQFARAIALLERATEVDPEADQLQALLVHLYRRTGANAAAAERYGQYASMLRRDLGVEPPGFDAM